VAQTSASDAVVSDEDVDRSLERPMAGVRVIDLSQGISGPYAAKWLAGLGADVVKVEPTAGDLSRRAGPWPNDVPDDETSGLYLYLNTNKRSVTLNLDTSDGRAICGQLIDGAAIVIESFAPGYLDERGLGYESLRSRNSALVMVSVTPFGQSGPYAHLPATELTLFALCGQMGLTGDPNQEPLKNGGSQPSYQAGLHAFTATQVAYFGALQHGAGTHLDISVQETFASMLEVYANSSSQLGVEFRGRMGNMLSAIWGRNRLLTTRGSA
jgi:crotonobetainyl-CoA:carnitine CoA-transferase CaiB-like acyl-CoA transferase